MNPMYRLQERLQQIHGNDDGRCVECSRSWPCASLRAIALLGSVCGSCDGDHDGWQHSIFLRDSAQGTAKRQHAKTVACPTCGRSPGEACRTSSGKRAEVPHTARIAFSKQTPTP